MGTFNIKDLLKDIQKLNNRKELCGITKKSNRMYDNGLTTAEVGFLHTQGSVAKQLPKRDFMFEVFEEKKQQYNKQLLDNITKEIKKTKRDLEKCFSKIGEQIVKDEKDIILHSGYGKWVDTTEQTKRNKKNKKHINDILQDEEKLINSLTHTKKG